MYDQQENILYSLLFDLVKEIRKYFLISISGKCLPTSNVEVRNFEFVQYIFSKYLSSLKEVLWR